ncbi:MAG: hypothetical protein ACREK8_11660 [Gemmatimonadales bacterium]
MISGLIPVFLNGRPCHVSPGCTLVELLSRQDPSLAEALERGTALATDARGIAADPAAVMPPGAIFRVVRSARTDSIPDA